MDSRNLSQLAAIGLGANLGDRAVTMTHALDALDALAGVEAVSISPLYRSAPWGDADQPEFRNAVAIVSCSLSPEELLESMKRIEDRLGKRPLRTWGPRAIDLDLLLYGDEYRCGATLQLPHPHIRERPFVYRPLEFAARNVEFPESWKDFLAGNELGRGIEAETGQLEAQGLWPSHPVPAEGRAISHSDEQTMELGRLIGATAPAGLIVALTGPLGAGKSCLARGIARGRGIEGPVPSPSYTLCREYQSSEGALQHWDFYRLEDGGDLESTSFFEKMNENALLVVEWANLFSKKMPSDGTVWIDLQPGNTVTSRTLAWKIPNGHLPLRAAMGEWSALSR